MASPTPSRILLCADPATAADDIRRPLEAAGHPLTPHAIRAADPGDLPGLQLVILDGTAEAAPALQFSRRLRGRFGDAFLPILFVTADHAPATRLASLECGADTYLLRPFEAAE